MKRYRLYGLDLASELSFTHAVPEVPPVNAEPDLVVELADRQEGERAGAGSDAPQVLYRSTEQRPDGAPVLMAARLGADTLLRYAGEASFRVGERRIAVRPELPGPEGHALAEVRLLGPVLAFWLERSRAAALHAAAVTIDGGAVALLASNRGGKSSLAAAFVDAGHPLLTDDVLAVEPAAGGFLARPSYPQMRFWPEDAARRLGEEVAAGLARAHPGFDKLRVPIARFDPEPRPLARLYLPARRPPGEPGSVVIEPLSPREALLALLAGSFLPRLVEAMGWGARRLDLLGRLAAAVPVRRIVLPHGLAHLPEAAARLAEDAVAEG